MKQAYISTHLADAQSAGDAEKAQTLARAACRAPRKRLGHLPPSPGGQQPFRHHWLRGEQRLLARGPRHRPIQAGRVAVPPLRLGTQLLPRLRPPPRLLLPAGRRHEPFPRRLRQGHRLQPLHQRAERRQPGALPGDAGTALPRDRTDLLIPKKQQLI